MRDLKLITPTDPVEAHWTLDFDIVDGIPQYVQYEQNTQDQRAAVAAYMVKGTIPGKSDLGVNWAGLYTGGNDTTLVTIDNEIKQSLQEYAAIPDGPNSTYIPQYVKDELGIHVVIYQG